MSEKAVGISQEIFGLADALQEKKQLKATLEDQLSAVNEEIAKIDRELSDAMAEAECPKFTHSGSTFYLSTKLYASPKAGMKEELIEALKKNGYGDLVSETVNANTLSSFCKGLLSECVSEEQLPAWLQDVVNTFDKVTVGVRKGSK